VTNQGRNANICCQFHSKWRLRRLVTSIIPAQFGTRRRLVLATWLLSGQFSSPALPFGVFFAMFRKVEVL
jgi:hypothetical protein